MQGVFIESSTERSLGYLSRHGPVLSMDSMVSIWWEEPETSVLIFVYRGVAHSIPDAIRSQKVIRIMSDDEIDDNGIHITDKEYGVVIAATNPDQFMQHIERWNEISDYEGLTI